MAVSNSFKALTALVLAVTLAPKLLIGAVVSNPSYGIVVESFAPFFFEEGFQVAYPAQFAGKEALIAMKDDCFMHVVPVAHQGWHEATIRTSVRPDQKLWFEFEGRLTEQHQETVYPLIVYYARKAVRYLGINTDFPPVLAIVAEGSCSIELIKWDRRPRIPFRMNRFGF